MWIYSDKFCMFQIDDKIRDAAKQGKVFSPFVQAKYYCSVVKNNHATFEVPILLELVVTYLYR